METNQHGHLILEYLRDNEFKVGDHTHPDVIMESAVDKGIGLDEIEDALIHASTNGWIMIADEQIHLTQSGYALLHPANDNLNGSA